MTTSERDKILAGLREAFEEALQKYITEQSNPDPLHKIVPVSDYLELQEKAWMYDDLCK